MHVLPIGGLVAVHLHCRCPCPACLLTLFRVRAQVIDRVGVGELGVRRRLVVDAGEPHVDRRPDTTDDGVLGETIPHNPLLIVLILGVGVFLRVVLLPRIRRRGLDARSGCRCSGRRCCGARVGGAAPRAVLLDISCGGGASAGADE